MPREVFVAGQILTAAELNSVSDQTVMSFAGTAARGSAIPSPVEGMVTYLQDSDTWEGYTTSWGPLASGFTASTAITATNASWPVPTLASPIVKVTVIGAGGGGASGVSGGNYPSAGSQGGTTTFDAGGAGTVTATGGAGGTNNTGYTGTAGLSAGNGGANGGIGSYDSSFQTGAPGAGGAITVSYLDLTGISTVNVTIGGGGNGPGTGGNGGRGEVIVEYVAG